MNKEQEFNTLFKEVYGEIAEPSFLIVIDNGKPYEVKVKNENELKAELKKQYAESQKEDNAFYDVKVYNENDEDISESQFITEIIGEIMSQEQEVLK